MNASNSDDDYPAKKLLDDLKNIKNREEDKIYDLETKIEEIERTENSLKVVVKTLEDTVREDKIKLNALDTQLMDSKHSCDSEKQEWLSTLEQANINIIGLSKELHFINTSQLKDKDEQISDLRQLWKDRKSEYEEERRKQIELIEENNRNHQNLLEKINKTMEHSEQLEKELELHKLENVQLKSEKQELEKIIIKLEDVSSQKNDFIKELETTARSNREILYSDKEFDLAINKLKVIRLKNKHLKLENVAYEEDNEKLIEENRQLKKTFEDISLEPEDKVQDQMNINKKLEENKKFSEQIKEQEAYQEMYEAVQKELDEIKVKAEIERETLISRLSRLECEKQTHEVKIASLDRARMEKIKTISELSLHNTDLIVMEPRTLNELEQNKLKSDKKISELQTQMQQYAKNESYLQDVVQNLETTILLSNEKVLELEEQAQLNQRNHEKEKSIWLSVLDQANERIMALNNIVQRLQNESDYDKAENLDGNLINKISEMKAVMESLEDQLDMLRDENVNQKIAISEADNLIANMKNDIYQKDMLIKEYEQTMKANQEMYFTENEFDIVLEKLKASKAENKSLKLENMTQSEEIENLKREISKLRKDFRHGELGAHVGNLLLKIKTLQQEKMKLQEQINASQSICSDGGRRPKAFRIKMAMDKKNNPINGDRSDNEKLLYLQNMNQ